MKFLTLPRVLLVLFIALVGGFLFLLLAPVEPLKINDVSIQGSSFKAGGELTFVIDRCKNVSSAVPGTASRYFVDANDKTKADIFISSTDDLGEKGCAIVTRTMDIPSHIKDGTYRLKFVTRYYPSILREPVKIEYITNQTFTVKGQELSVQLQSILEQLNVINGTIGLKPQALSSGSVSSIAPTVQTTPQQPTQQPVQPTDTPESQQGILRTTIDGINNLIRGIL